MVPCLYNKIVSLIPKRSERQWLRPFILRSIGTSKIPRHPTSPYSITSTKSTLRVPIVKAARARFFRFLATQQSPRPEAEGS